MGSTVPALRWSASRTNGPAPNCNAATSAPNALKCQVFPPPPASRKATSLATSSEPTYRYRRRPSGAVTGPSATGAPLNASSAEFLFRAPVGVVAQARPFAAVVADRDGTHGLRDASVHAFWGIGAGLRARSEGEDTQQDKGGDQ